MSYRNRGFESRSSRGQFGNYRYSEPVTQTSNFNENRGCPRGYEQGRSKNPNDRDNYPGIDDHWGREAYNFYQSDANGLKQETYNSRPVLNRPTSYSGEPSYGHSYSEYDRNSSNYDLQTYDYNKHTSFNRGEYSRGTTSPYKPHNDGTDSYYSYNSLSHDISNNLYSAPKCSQSNPNTHNLCNFSVYNERSSNSLYEENPYNRSYCKPNSYSGSSNSRIAGREYPQEIPRTSYEKDSSDLQREYRYSSGSRNIPVEQRKTGYYRDDPGEINFSQNTLGERSGISPRESFLQARNSLDSFAQSGNAHTDNSWQPNKKFKGVKKPQTTKQMRSQRQKKGAKKFKKGRVGKVAIPQAGKVNDEEFEDDDKEEDGDKDDGDDDDDFFHEEFVKNAKKAKFDGVNTLEDQINQVRARCTPLWKIPYPEQLRLKHKSGINMVQRICDNMSKENQTVKHFLKKLKEVNNGLPCKIHDIVYQENGYNYYKNKVNLVVGLDSLTKKPCAGMRCGVGGCCSLEDDLLIIPKEILPHIRAFESFLNGVSKYIVSSRDCNGKCWKQLSFRNGVRTNQVMMMVGFNVNDLDDPDIFRAKNELKAYFSGKRGDGITSLWLHVIRNRRRGGPSNHYHHVSGSRYIEEIVNGVKFRITPHSGFPNSLWSAELTNEVVKKIGSLNKDSVLIDVASPVGTLSLCLSKEIKQAVFINTKIHPRFMTNTEKTLLEVAPDNKVTNWSLNMGKVEKALPVVIKKNNITEQSDALIYFDPFSSLRKPGVEALHGTKEINRMLFLTYGKKLMLDNFTNLAKVNTQANQDDTFVPVEAVSMDAYPHTGQLSVFVLMERLKLAKARLQQN